MHSSSHFGPAASLETLQQRAVLLRSVREFFHARNYWEVETPLLSHDSCIDVWLDPFSVPLDDGQVAYLQTSPEFSMKRLICAGADRIFEITRSFRKGEQGRLHNPEFTIIEWYALRDDHHLQMKFVEELVLHLHRTTIAQGWNSPAPIAEKDFHRISYEEAFQRFVGLSPFTASLKQLASAAAQGHSQLPEGIEEDRDGLLNLLLADRIEPQFKELRAVFLYDYPASQAALAKKRIGPPDVAERFELYLDGIEICNGYHELTDAGELRQRMLQQNQQRHEAGKLELPVESRLLNAMEQGMPGCSGVALGFDRLAMWCLKLASLQEIMSFPFDRT